MKKRFLFCLSLSVTALTLGLLGSFNNSNEVLMSKATEEETLPFALESDLYDLAVVGDGLVYGEDIERENAVRFGDKETYLTVTPKEGKKLADEEGMTVSFWQRNNTNTLSASGTNEFERYLSFKDADGNFGCWAPGGVSYDMTPSGGSSAYKNTYNIYAMLNTTWKYVTVSFDFVNKTADTYYNGTLYNTRKHATDADSFWNTYIGLVQNATLQEGGQVIFRGQFASSAKQTESSMFDEIKIEHGYLDEAGAAAKFALVAEQDFDVEVTGLSKDQYSVNVIGNAANIYDAKHEKGVWFSKYNQYLSIAPKSGNLVSDDGFTLSFWEKCLRKTTNTGDVNAATNTAAASDFIDNSISNNDAWVNIITVEGETGKDAAICAGAVWSTKEDESGTDYKDASSRKFMFNNEWQYISISVDFSNDSVTYYQNGVQVATIPACTALTNVLTKFKYHFLNGGALNFRKSLSIRYYRNHSGLEFDGIKLSPTLLGADTITSLYETENAKIEDNYAVKNFVFSSMEMKENTEGQCLTYYPLAKAAYLELSNAQKEIFLGSEKYAEAAARLAAWARANNDVIEGLELKQNQFNLGVNSNSSTLIITMTVLCFVSAIGLVVIIKRKRA